MKNSVPLLALLFFIACSGKKNETRTHADTTSKAAPAAITSFADNFDTLSRDSMLVYPRMSSNASDEPAYPFSGHQIKDIDYQQVDTSLFEHPVKRKMKFYATNKIPLGKDHSGLLLRTPSIYWESAVYLLLWDNAAARVTDQLQVAEWWGDAGDIVFIQSWLLDLNKKDPKILVVKKITHPKDPENPAVTVTTDTVYRYSIENNKFKLESKAETDRDFLRKKYNIMLRNITTG